MGVAGGLQRLAVLAWVRHGVQSGGDARYEQYGVPLVTTKKFALHLDGTTIDFKDGPMGRGFAIDNPNYAQGGGCPGCGGH